MTSMTRWQRVRMVYLAASTPSQSVCHSVQHTFLMFSDTTTFPIVHWIQEAWRYWILVVKQRLRAALYAIYGNPARLSAPRWSKSSKQQKLVHLGWNAALTAFHTDQPPWTPNGASETLIAWNFGMLCWGGGISVCACNRASECNLAKWYRHIVL